MGKKILIFIVAGLMVFSFSSAALAQEQTEQTEERPTCNLSWTFYSKYVWRGYELSKDSLVMFPSITVSYKGFAMNMWGDMDTSYKGVPSGADNEQEWWETDWILTYSNTWKKLNYTLGWIYYDVDPGNNQEMFTTLGLDVLLKPTLSVYREIELPGERWYVNLGLSHSFSLGEREIFGSKCMEHSLDVGAWISYMSINTSDFDYEAMHDGNIWAAYNIPINSYLTISPSINYSFPLSNTSQTNIRDACFNRAYGKRDGDSSASYVYGGVTLKMSF